MAASKNKSELDPESLHFRVLTELEKGRKIQAIKLLREELGIGLKEAKEAVERIAEEYGLDTPKSGCAASLLIFSLAGAVWWTWCC